MALTPSTMIPLNTQAPNFTLLDVISGKMVSLSDLKSPQGTVIIFMCNHCPFVIHIRAQLVEVAKTYMAKGLSVIAINSNDVISHPGDSPENMKKDAAQFGYPFPYLFDETQEVAKSYDAACTPDFFVFDGNLKCVYRGQFDDSRPGNNSPITGQDLSKALDCLLSGTPIPTNQKPSIGCNIKWKS